MKRYWIATLIVAALATVVAVSAKLWLGHQGGEGPGELYKRCVERTDLETIYVEDLRVDDSTTVSTTIVSALSDEGWEWMCREFRIPAFIAHSDNPTMTVSYCAVYQHPEQVFDPDCDDRRDLVVFSIGRRMLHAYHLPKDAPLPVVPMAIR